MTQHSQRRTLITVLATLLGCATTDSDVGLSAQRDSDVGLSAQRDSDDQSDVVDPGTVGTADGGGEVTSDGPGGGQPEDAPTNLSDSGDPNDSGVPGDEWEAFRAACVNRINGFRATEGLAPLARWRDAERCTDDQSAQDAAPGGGAHANFGICDERAQNTCPGWPSADAVVERCLQAMWDEGPGQPFSEHGHYINMSNPGYTRVACGFARTASGGIWHNHNFAP